MLVYATDSIFSISFSVSLRNLATLTLVMKLLTLSFKRFYCFQRIKLIIFYSRSVCILTQNLFENMNQFSGTDLVLTDISEAEIETNFKSYRPYIESCVKTIDLLVFFKLFTIEQVKPLYKKAKVDPVDAIKEAFDIISDMKNTLYKFHHLLSALEEAEYPKIVRLLTGELIRVHDNHRQKLKTFAVDIFQRLCISELLPYLLTKQVLTNNDLDEILSIEKSESRGSAVMLLLSLLPNRNRDWYKHFLGDY